MTIAAFAVFPVQGEVWAQEQPGGVRSYTMVRNSIPQSLTGVPGDPVAGRNIAMSRDLGNCILCHALPDGGAALVTGNVGPPLAGVGARLTAADLRMRLVDSTRINPDSVMPAYYRVDRLTRVAAAYQGKSVLTAQQIEDVLVYLQGLR
jgi:sulfur-oxidizing protein SoxX